MAARVGLKVNFGNQQQRNHPTNPRRVPHHRGCRLVVQFVARILAPSYVPRGFTSLIILILFLGGIQLLCLSIIGSYLEHIYDEVKRRPPYIVESILNEPNLNESKLDGHSQPAEDAMRYLRG